MAWQIDPDARKPPQAAPDKPKRRVSRQRRERMDRDAEYLALKDMYLAENPECTFASCVVPATQIHHIVRGTAGRARSLLNTNTWLGVCGGECHDALERLPVEIQIAIKQNSVRLTIERLRR